MRKAVPQRRTITMLKKHIPRSRYRPHQGAQECARRVRQMARAAARSAGAQPTETSAP